MSREKAEYFCTELLTVLVTSADWLLIFKPTPEQSLYQSVTLVTPEECSRLIPWAFCRLGFP